MNPFYVSDSTPENKQVMLGNLRPARVRSMPNDAIIMMIDSKERQSGNDYNYTVTVQKPITAPLNVSVARVSIPKIPNINAINNTITFVHQLGTFTFRLTPGYYNQNSLVNALTNGFDAAAGGGDNFIVTFNTLNRTMSIASNGGYKWFFASTCSFILYGANVANFASLPITTPYTSGSITQYSGNCGLLYSRFVAIQSNTLMKYAKEVPRSSLGLCNTITFISMVNAYDEADFSVSNVYQGNIILDVTSDISSIINLAQSGNALTYMDFSFIDEYGFNLGDSLTLGSPYNAPALGTLIWLIINV